MHHPGRAKRYPGTSRMHPTASLTPAKPLPCGANAASVSISRWGTPPPHPGLILPLPRCSAPSGSAPATMGIGAFLHQPTPPRCKSARGGGGGAQRWLQPPHHPSRMGASPPPHDPEKPGGGELRMRMEAPLPRQSRSRPRRCRVLLGAHVSKHDASMHTPPNLNTPPIPPEPPISSIPRTPPTSPHPFSHHLGTTATAATLLRQLLGSPTEPGGGEGRIDAIPDVSHVLQRDGELRQSPHHLQHAGPGGRSVPRGPRNKKNYIYIYIYICPQVPPLK